MKGLYYRNISFRTAKNVRGSLPSRQGFRFNHMLDFKLPRNPLSRVSALWYILNYREKVFWTVSRSNLNISIQKKITEKIINEQYQMFSICFHGQVPQLATFLITNQPAGQYKLVKIIFVSTITLRNISDLLASS